MAYTPELGTRFWFAFDDATQGSSAFMTTAAKAGAFGVQDDFRNTRSNGTYPAAFRQKFLPRRKSWLVVADVQTKTIGDILGADWSDIQAAFEDFGQGTLLDPDPQRQADNNAIHMMDGQVGNPPIGYHRWHASIRAIQLLDIGDRDWWENLDRLVGLAWGIQSFAKPRQQNTPNPAISQADLQDLRDAWLALTPEQRDRQYDLTDGPSGFHPSPKMPSA